MGRRKQESSFSTLLDFAFRAGEFVSKYKEGLSLSERTEETGYLDVSQNTTSGKSSRQTQSNEPKEDITLFHELCLCKDEEGLVVLHRVRFSENVNPDHVIHFTVSTTTLSPNKVDDSKLFILPHSEILEEHPRNYYFTITTFKAIDVSGNYHIPEANEENAPFAKHDDLYETSMRIMRDYKDKYIKSSCRVGARRLIKYNETNKSCVLGTVTVAGLGMLRFEDNSTSEDLPTELQGLLECDPIRCGDHDPINDKWGTYVGEVKLTNCNGWKDKKYKHNGTRDMKEFYSRIEYFHHCRDYGTIKSMAELLERFMEIKDIIDTKLYSEQDLEDTIKYLDRKRSDRVSHVQGQIKGSLVRVLLHALQFVVGQNFKYHPDITLTGQPSDGYDEDISTSVSGDCEDMAFAYVRAMYTLSDMYRVGAFGPHVARGERSMFKRAVQAFRQNYVPMLMVCSCFTKATSCNRDRDRDRENEGNIYDNAHKVNKVSAMHMTAAVIRKDNDMKEFYPNLVVEGTSRRAIISLDDREAARLYYPFVYFLSDGPNMFNIQTVNNLLDDNGYYTQNGGDGGGNGTKNVLFGRLALEVEGDERQVFEQLPPFQEIDYEVLMESSLLTPQHTRPRSGD